MSCRQLVSTLSFIYWDFMENNLGVNGVCSASGKDDRADGFGGGGAGVGVEAEILNIINHETKDKKTIYPKGVQQKQVKN